MRGSLWAALGIVLISGSLGGVLGQAADVGDRVAVMRFAELRRSGKVVDSVSPGQILTVLATADRRLWVSRGKPGWIEEGHTIALGDAEASLGSVFVTGASARDYLARGNIRIATGKVELGLRDLEKAVQLTPHPSDYLPALGFGQLTAMKHAAAIETFSTALRLDPQSAAARMGRGLAYYQAGQLQNALTDFQAAIGLEPEHAFARKYAGAVMHDLGQLEPAAEMLRSAIALDGHDSFTRRAYGRLLYDLSEWEAAWGQFDVAVQLDPEDIEALTGRGVVGYALGVNLDQVLHDYQQAVSLAEATPEQAHLWSNLGQILAERGATEQALQNFRQAIQLDETFTEARSLRAYYLMTQLEAPTNQQIQQASDDLRKVFSDKTTARSFWDYQALAATNAKRGDWKRAEKFQQQAIEVLGPSGPPRFLSSAKRRLMHYQELHAVQEERSP